MNQTVTSRIFKTMLISIFVLCFTTDCTEKKSTNKSDSKIDLKNISNINNISLRVAVVRNELIEKSNDSMIVELLVKQQKNHNQIDSILKSVAQNNLIVLSDTVFQKQNIIKTISENQLEFFLEYIKNQKRELEATRKLNRNSQMNAYYQLKIDELKKNINEINELIKSRNINLPQTY
ncbi:hypothetical protein [Flavobacterium orientale]|uniref:DUF4142 domain-containing protein n=1 Tax=Flavobacterium orientale TaxID=1756020 RepID=A0A916Y9S4_9FLAO|nr:hypothetical protein [Flavobacterium orientale]GGD35563.1 hypothetical protein GCM10011343_26820 [Flavobacterium orientale]